MALDIYTNNYSIIAQNNLASANNLMTKSIERLSSGLRINHASDDASGLVISEKLRAQIRGLDKASSNAQDAVSFLQTAEGGMEVIGDMLQRMRELAVQAGNGTYTSGDRQQIQKEVDQLKSEINRISSSTEYNTKKLLTGESSALWSSNNSGIEAIVRGAPAEGNYKLEISTVPGQNAVYKSDVMDLKDPAVVATRTGATAAELVSYSTLGNFQGSGTATLNFDTTANAARTISGAAGATDKGTNAYAGTVTAIAAGTTTTQSGYYIIEVTGDDAAGATATNMTMTWIDAATGKADKAVITQALSTSQATTATFTLEGSGEVIKVTFAATSATSILENGQKWYGAVQTTSTAASEGMLKADLTDSNTDNAVLAVGAKYASAVGSGTAYAVSIDKATGEYTVFGMSAKWDGPAAAGQTGEYFTQTFDVKAETVADGNTALAKIARFTNADGRMILDNTQELTVYGNGKQATIYLEGCDSIDDFDTKLTNALIELGMGDPNSDDPNSEINKNLVRFVTDATDGGNEAVPGTFVIQSALPGQNSVLSFAGDESLINALSLAKIQTETKSQTTVTVYDAHTGEEVGSDTVCDGVLRGVIKGVDVKIDANLGVKAEWKDGAISFSTDDTTAFLHVVDNSTKVQVGANEGQTFDISIGQMNTTSLGIDDAYVTTMAMSQKAITKFDEALTQVNSARATIGAQINRLEYTMKNLTTSKQNLISGESRIRDLDVASASAEFARNQILVNAATAMLAQANTLPQSALQLIGR